jgi:hypothetical protein
MLTPIIKDAKIARQPAHQPVFVAGCWKNLDFKVLHIYQVLFALAVLRFSPLFVMNYLDFLYYSA